MQAYGVEPSKLTAEEFARFNLVESAKWLDVMKRARVEPNYAGGRRDTPCAGRFAAGRGGTGRVSGAFCTLSGRFTRLQTPPL